jgi:hypothetical protein
MEADATPLNDINFNHRKACLQGVLLNYEKKTPLPNAGY